MTGYLVCPRCGDMTQAPADYCHCGGALVPGVRSRWFCSFCGAITLRRPSPSDGLVRCHAHSNLPAEVDAAGPDPITSLPTVAAEYETELTRLGDHVVGWASTPAPERAEDPPAAKGTGR